MALRTIYPQRHFLTVDGTINGIVGIADVTQLVVGATGMIYDVNNDPLPISVAYVDTVNSKLTLNSNGTTLDARPFTASGGAVVDFPFQMVDGPEAIPPWYTIPIASPTVLGGIKVGANLSIDVGGVLSADPGVVAPYTLQGIGDTVPLTINAISGQTANLQVWTVNGVERAKLDASGLLTVGTGNGTASGFSVFSQYNPVMFRGENRASGSTTSGAFIGLFQNTLGGGYIMQSGHRMGGFFFGGNSGDDANLRNSAGVFGFASQTWVNNTGYGSYLSFATTNNDSTTRSEKMKLDHSGALSLTPSSDAVVFNINAVNGQTNKLLNWQVNGVDRGWVAANAELTILGSIFVPGGSGLWGRSIGNKIIPDAAGSISLGSVIPDGAAAVAHILNTSPALTIAGSKLLSIRNNGVEKVYIDKDGNAALGLGSATATLYWRPDAASSKTFSISASDSGIAFQSTNNTPLTFQGSGGGGITFGTTVTFSGGITDLGTNVNFGGGSAGGAGSLVYSKDATNGATLQTYGSKPLYINPAGNGMTLAAGDFLVTSGTITLGSGKAAYFGATGNAIFGYSAGSPLTIRSGNADGAAAVGTAITTSSTYSTTGAKLLSIQNNGTEKASVDKDGHATFLGTSNHNFSGNIVIASGKQCTTNRVGSTSGGSPVTIQGAVNSGSGNANCVINGNYNLVGATDKLLLLKNFNVDKAYVDKDGYITSAGSPVSRKVAVPATAASAGVPGDWAADSSWLYICTATNTWQRTAITLATW